MTEEHLMLIPPEGLIHVFHAEKPVDIQATLAGTGGEGTFMTLDLTTDDQPIGKVSWFVTQTGPVNPRARIALTSLADVHMLFTGPVMIHGVDHDRLAEVLVELSLSA